MIKYHQYGLGKEYGQDHMLTNNWNPDKDYGNEYVSIYFQMETKGFGYPSFYLDEESRQLFELELSEVFTKLGWSYKTKVNRGVCSTWINGNSHLYMHPQTFSGEVLKNDVKRIAESLQNRDMFTLRWVDLRSTVYDITDDEYERYLDTKADEICTDLFTNFTTTRRTKFYRAFDVCKTLADKYRLKRINDKDGLYDGKGKTSEFILKVVNKMIEDNTIISAYFNDELYIRSLNKTEKKKMGVA